MRQSKEVDLKALKPKKVFEFVNTSALKPMLYLFEDDETKTWVESKSRATGKWLEYKGKLYLNYDRPFEDVEEEGNFQGFRIYKQSQT